MTTNYRVAIVFILAVISGAWASEGQQFAIKGSRRDENGITFQTATGAMRIEACGDRVIHVVASRTSEIPQPKVPVATQPCRANSVQVKTSKNEVRLSTSMVTAAVDSATGAVSFLSADGKSLLTEPKQGGKVFDVPSLFEAKTWQVQQTFLSPSDESLYGLGQHQEGIFDLRGVPFVCIRPTPTFPFQSCCQARDTASSGTTPRSLISILPTRQSR